MDSRYSLKKCAETQPEKHHHRNPMSDGGHFMKCNKTVITETENVMQEGPMLSIITV